MWDGVAAFIGGLFGGRRRPQHEFAAAIRLVGGGPWRGRWRHGWLTITQTGLRWRPQALRPGPPADLPHPGIGGQRGMRWWEHWWLAGGLRIVTVDSDSDRYELAVESATIFRMKRIPSQPERWSGSSGA